MSLPKGGSFTFGAISSDVELPVCLVGDGVSSCAPSQRYGREKLFDARTFPEDPIEPFSKPGNHGVFREGGTGNCRKFSGDIIGIDAKKIFMSLV
jgi:hypothetical protein